MRPAVLVVIGLALVALGLYTTPLSVFGPMVPPTPEASRPSVAVAPVAVVPTVAATSPVARPASPTPPPSRPTVPIAPPAPTPTPKAGFPTVELDPVSPLPGSTLLVRVLAPDAAAAGGSFDGKSIAWLRDARGVWGLAPVPLDLTAGRHNLDLAVQVGDEVKLASLPVAVGARPVSAADFTALAAGGSLPLPYLSSVPYQRWQGPFQPPLSGEVSSPFGSPRLAAAGVPPFHQGMDFAVDFGTPVRAANNGQAVWAGWLPGAGLAVIIDHGLGVHSGYYHLSQLDVAEGNAVATGQVIGRVGSTGASTGPHLHWEMRVNGVAVDPMQWAARSVGG